LGKVISKGLECFDKKNFDLELEGFSNNKTLVEKDFSYFQNHLYRARQENDLQLKQLLCKIANMTKNITDFTICLKFISPSLPLKMIDSIISSQVLAWNPWQIFFPAIIARFNFSHLIWICNQVKFRISLKTQT